MTATRRLERAPNHQPLIEAWWSRNSGEPVVFFFGFFFSGQEEKQLFRIMALLHGPHLSSNV